MFKGKGVFNDNGSVDIKDGRLWIKGKIFWERNKPEESVLNKEIEKLLEYNPQIKEHKTISY